MNLSFFLFHRIFGRTLVAMREMCFILLACLIFGTGCSDAVEPGRIDFMWRLGSQGCDQYGVETVRGSLYGFHSADPILSKVYECELEMGSFIDVTPGEYTLMLEGLNDEDCMTHIVRKEVVVGSGQRVSLERTLSLVRHRRPIQLTWNFDNNLDCLGNDVTQVEIRVEVDDEEGFTEVRACEGFSTTIQGDVAPGELTVSIFGVNDVGERMFNGQTTLPKTFFTEDPCTPRLDVLTVLSPCAQSNCEG